MSDSVITVENLSKQYIISHQRGHRDDGLSHVIEAAVRAPFRWLRSRREQTRKGTEEFWALNDVSFSIKQGEAAIEHGGEA